MGSRVRRLGLLVAVSVACAGCHGSARENEADLAVVGAHLTAATTRTEQLAALSALSAVPPDAVPAATKRLVRAQLGSADSVVVAKAADLLAQWADPAGTAALVRLLHDDDATLRLAAATSLAVLADPAAEEPLAAATHDRDASVRAQACAALGNLGRPTVLPHVRACLDDGDDAVRAAALAALARVGTMHDAPRARVLLQDKDPGVASAAIAALGALGDQRAVVAIQPLLSHPMQTLRCSAAAALGRLGDESAVQPLLRALDAADLPTRIAVLNALRALGSPAAIAGVLNAAKGGNPLLAKRIPFVLAALYRPAQFDRFVAYAESADAQVRASVVLALGLAGERRAEPLLRAALADPAPMVRANAITGLGVLGIKDTADVVAGLARNDTDPDVRDAGTFAQAVARGAPDPLVLRLVRALGESASLVRRRAAEVLGLLGAVKAEAPLRRVARHDWDRDVRAEASLALLRIEDPNA